MLRISRSKYRYYLLLFIPIVTSIVVACSSTPKKIELTDETASQWDSAVDKTITDPQRAVKLKAMGKELIDISNSMQQDVDTFNQKAMELNENYYATKAEFDQVLNDYMAKRSPKLVKYRNLIFAMRNEVNAEEWKALTK